MLQPGHHIQWNQAPIPLNFAIPNQNPFLPELPLQVQLPRGQRRNPNRGQQRPPILQAGMEQRHLEQQRLLEEQRLALRANRLELVRQQQEQERQREEVVRLENQQYYNQAYQLQRAQLEQDLIEQQEARRIGLEAQIEHNRLLAQHVPQLHFGAQRGRAPALVHAPEQAQRVVRAVVPAPVRGAAAGIRRTRRA